MNCVVQTSTESCRVALQEQRDLVPSVVCSGTDELANWCPEKKASGKTQPHPQFSVISRVSNYRFFYHSCCFLNNRSTCKKSKHTPTHSLSLSHAYPKQTKQKKGKKRGDPHMPLSNLKSWFSFKFSPRFASTISGSCAASRCCGREYACARHWNYCAGKNKLDLVFPKRAKKHRV